MNTPRLVPATNTVSNLGRTAAGFLSANSFFLGLTLSFLVIMWLYWKYIGYTVSASYNSLMDLLSSGKTASIGVDMDNDGVPEGGATLKHEEPMKKSDLPAGIPGSQAASTSAAEIRDAILPTRKEVFNVSRNIYTYEDASPVCKAMGAELATFEQIQEAHKHGADWCNYGWVKGQMAVFPTQKTSWEKLQNGPPEYRNACGRPGVNGGFFDNPELRFGVNCYGVRPERTATDELLSENGAALPLTPDEINFERKVQKFRDQLDTITVLPWNKGKWTS